VHGVSQLQCIQTWTNSCPQVFEAAVPCKTLTFGYDIRCGSYPNIYKHGLTNDRSILYSFFTQSEIQHTKIPDSKLYFQTVRQKC